MANDRAVALVINRPNVNDPESRDWDEAKVPLGTFLSEARPDEEFDSVEAVRELRGRN